MNKRIKELANQCYQTGPLGRDGWPEYTKFDEEKFAELIIKECMTQIKQVREIKAGHAGPEYTQGFDDGMVVAINTIESNR